jgi:hypothetical protein
MGFNIYDELTIFSAEELKDIIEFCLSRIGELENEKTE